MIPWSQQDRKTDIFFEEWQEDGEKRFLSIL